MPKLVTSNQGFDMSIIDTPPFSVFSDAILLGSMVDGVIFAVNANKTPKH